MYRAPLLTAALAITAGLYLAVHTGHGAGAFAVGYAVTTWLAHMVLGVEHRDTHHHALLAPITIALLLVALFPGARHTVRNLAYRLA